MSNSRGGRACLRPDSYYFDQLPQTLRHALAHAAFDWSSKYFLDRWNRGTHSIPDLIREIKRADSDKAAEPVSYRKPGNFGWSKQKTAYADRATRVSVLYPEGYSS